MHIPDGFLATNVLVPTWLISMGGLGYCLKRTSRILKDKMVPLMGVMAAFIFAAQMLNFPIIGGTSGHLSGGVLAVVLLGPYAGAIVIAIVLIVQCFVFQDGGLTVLGANIFNMSFLGATGGFLVYYTIRKVIRDHRGIIVASTVAAWFSIIISSSAVAVELALSGTSPLKIALPAMAGVHSVIGIGEAAITNLVISIILKLRSDLIYQNE